MHPNPPHRPAASAPATPPVRRPARSSRAWLLAWGGLVITGVVVATVLHRPAPHEPQRNVASAPEAEAQASVLVRSSEVFSVASSVEAGQVVTTVSEGARSFRLIGNGGDRVDDGQGTHWTIRDKDDGFVVEDGSRSFRFKARDDGGYSLRDAAGEVMFRVKHKDDKFNVYDASGTRILYGKLKKGQIVLRSASDQQVGSVEGSDLRRAAALVLPVPVPVRAIAYARRVDQLLP